MNRLVFPVYKPPGLTPLQTLILLKEQYPEYRSDKLSYAGRLDPMAEGLLLVLVGEENKNRHAYESLPKQYDFDVLCGISTDTYDVMGRILASAKLEINQKLLGSLDAQLSLLRGKQILPYPPYSSKPVNGKPLFWYAREKLLDTITIPSQTVTIEKLERMSIERVNNAEIYTSVMTRISRVLGKFRQNEIRQDWDAWRVLNNIGSSTVMRCSATVSSGTYIRGLVHELESKLHIPLLTYQIIRTQIGMYSPKDGLRLLV